MKEKLIIPFFWLAIVSWGLAFFSTALDSIRLGPIATLVDIVRFFVTVLLALVSIRLLSELAVAVFRINDNLSPDGGKSETADIDIVAEARKAAEEAANRAMELSKSASEKTKSSFDAAKDKKEASAAKPTAASATKASVKKAPAKKPAPAKTTAPKTSTSKANPTSAKASSAPKKRGPKPGSKAPRDADGNLLKKDGTPRKKPGPRKK